MTKKEIAAHLEEIATLMELSGENPFKTRSYVNAARTIEQTTEDIHALVEEGRLRELKGIGVALAEKIAELVCKGSTQYLEELRAQFPVSLFGLFQIPGLGPKRIKQLYDELGIDSIEKLEQACGTERLLKLRGFSKKLVDKILEGIAFARRHEGMYLFNKANNAAWELVQHIVVQGLTTRIQPAGSIRRRKEVIRDIDIVAASTTPEKVIQCFVTAPGVTRITGQGETKSSVVLESGIAVDLRVVTDTQFPFAVAYFTGSKEHNVRLRSRAKELGLKLNEYGLFRENGELIPCKEEAGIYRALKIPYVPPELREDRGEFEASKLPVLLNPDDILGVIHNHTTYSDGAHAIEAMAAYARERGYQYIHISDHSQSAAYANGLKADRVAAQQQEIDRINTKNKGFTILKGIESDIRNDGSLDYPDEVLATFDLVIASVHSKLDMSLEEATSRTIRAIENPYTDILGHPTGRLLLEREGFPLDMEKVFDACVANNVAVEINANCRRLDVDWRHIRRGKEKGVRFSIGPDAHNAQSIDNLCHGVGIARKGWLEKGDVLNCMTARELLQWRKAR